MGKIRGPDNNMDIGEYEMVTEAKYLGVMLGGYGRDIFRKSNEEFLANAEKQVFALMRQIKEC